MMLRANLNLSRRRGVELPWLTCGKRKLVRGSDAIAFIEMRANKPAH
jgi:hypothetical protein